ncbi:hypothetical protein AGMMS49944_18360 [Spirochaetia bacterium]|nr:hypothetical protein AGMMS49944_18360 [Spirochaetia bacterium]
MMTIREAKRIVEARGYKLQESLVVNAKEFFEDSLKPNGFDTEEIGHDVFVFTLHLDNVDVDDIDNDDEPGRIDVFSEWQVPVKSLKDHYERTNWNAYGYTVNGISGMTADRERGGDVVFSEDVDTNEECLAAIRKAIRAVRNAK